MRRDATVGPALNTLFQLKANCANAAAVDGAQVGQQLQKDIKVARDGLRLLDEKARQSASEDAPVITSQEQREIAALMTNNQLNGSEIWTLQSDPATGTLRLGGELTGRTNTNVIDTLRGRLEDRVSDLEAKDKIGNFELQDLMATLNQNHTLASTTLKELTNIRTDTIRRIGG